MHSSGRATRVGTLFTVQPLQLIQLPYNNYYSFYYYFYYHFYRYFYYYFCYLLLLLFNVIIIYQIESICSKLATTPNNCMSKKYYNTVDSLHKLAILFIEGIGQKKPQTKLHIYASSYCVNLYLFTILRQQPYVKDQFVY